MDIIDLQDETEKITEEIDQNENTYKFYNEFIKTAKFNAKKDQELFKENKSSLQSIDPEERKKSIKAFSGLSNKFILIKFYKIALDDESPAIRLAVVNQIPSLPEKISESLFKAAILNSESSIKSTSIKMLCKIKKEGSIPLLRPIIEDDDAYVRGMAVTCLGLYCGKEGLNLISEFKDDDDPHVQKCIADIINIVQIDTMPQKKSTKKNKIKSKTKSAIKVKNKKRSKKRVRSK